MMLHGASRDSEMAIRQIQAERRVAYLSLAFPTANSYAIIEFPAVGRDRRYEKYKDHSVFPHESRPTSTESKTQPFAYSAFKIASLERRRPRDPRVSKQQAQGFRRPGPDCNESLPSYSAGSDKSPHGINSTPGRNASTDEREKHCNIVNKVEWAQWLLPVVSSIARIQN